MFNNKKLYQIFLLIIIIFIVFSPKVMAAESIIFENIETIKSGEDNENIIIKWRTNVETRGILHFGINSTDLVYKIAEPETKSLSRWHEVELSNLKADSVYYYKIEAYNSLDRAETFVNNFDTDDLNIIEAAPKIKNLDIFYISATVAAIRWNTDIEASSIVQYGTDKNYKAKKAAGKSTTEHLAIITKLKPDTKYYVKIYATNKDKVKSSEYHREFTTRRQGVKNEGELVIYNFHPNGPKDAFITSNSITVDFEINNLAKGYLYVSAEGMRKQKYEFKYDIVHNLYLGELSPDKCYKFDFRLKDIFGNKWNNVQNICTPQTGIYQDITNSEDVVRTEFDLSNKEEFFDENANDEEMPSDDDVIILGVTHSYYTPSAGLIKTANSTRIYTVLAGQRHTILSPSIFSEYGYNWGDVKTVSQTELEKYPDVRLVKTPESGRIYFLWRKENSTKKISIPNPEVFNSYSSNKWEDVVKISENDLNSYSDVVLVKTKDGNQIYVLENGQKSLISAEEFESKGFNEEDILIISQVHFNTIGDKAP